MAYLACIAVGIIIGLVISRYLPAMKEYVVEIKQRGRNNALSVEKVIEVNDKPKKERRLKKWRLKRKTKE